jgi:threonine synthase
MLLDNWFLTCIGCNAIFEKDIPSFRCPKCGDLFELQKKRLPELKELYGSSGQGIWRFSSALPIKQEKAVSLDEGGTPLLEARNIKCGNLKIFFKVEGLNPTGSFKDRGMTVAISHALKRGTKLAICASTGNTSSSLAAYSARAGIGSAVIVPANAVSAVKLVQASMHGARIFKVRGNFDLALKKVTDFASKHGFYLVNSINPYRIEGQKTVAYEIYEQLTMEMPDYLFVPVGNAGNISAIFKGFYELLKIGGGKRLPKLVGVQARDASPVVEVYSKNSEKLVPLSNPKTVASAIRIGNPVSWKKALRAVKESKGAMISVTDEEILKARDMLAKEEGLLVEAASAASLAGLLKYRKMLDKSKNVVCILTGTGLKDAYQDSEYLNIESVSELEKIVSNQREPHC